MPQFVETLQVIRTSVLEVVSFEEVEPSQAPEDGLVCKLTLDTPVDGDAGHFTIFITRKRAEELGLLVAEKESPE